MFRIKLTTQHNFLSRLHLSTTLRSFIDRVVFISRFSFFKTPKTYPKSDPLYTNLFLFSRYTILAFFLTEEAVRADSALTRGQGGTVFRADDLLTKKNCPASSKP